MYSVTGFIKILGLAVLPKRLKNNVFLAPNAAIGSQKLTISKTLQIRNEYFFRNKINFNNKSEKKTFFLKFANA